MAIKHSRQGIAIGASAALGLAMLGASPAFASGDADFVDLHLVAPGNGVMAGIIEQDFGLLLEWDADVDTKTFDDLTWAVLSVVDQKGNDIAFDAQVSAPYYDYEDDDVYYDTYEDYNLTAPESRSTPWAFQLTDDVSSGNGYVGLVDADATKNEFLNANTTYYADYFGEYFNSPWLRLGVYDEDLSSWDYSWDITKITYRIQAFVDSNGNGEADGNEVRSSVATFTQLNEHRFEGTVSQANLPGFFFPELEPTITLNQKLTDFTWEEDNGMDEEVAEESYNLKLQQVDSDGNDSNEYNSWNLEDYNQHEDDKGWGIDEDGNVTLTEQTFSYTNEGSKVNKLWLWSPERETRVSNLATFGYVADSKIVKRSNTTAKMYAFDILNAGKVDFRHNGRVIASIDLVDEGDPRALADGNRPYFVRTVNFVRGKNTLEVVVNGKVLKKHTYTLRSGMA